MSTIDNLLLSQSSADRVNELQEFLESVGEADQMLQPGRLVARLIALNDLDAIIGGIDPCTPTTSSESSLLARAEAVRSEFEAANEVLYEAVHAEISLQGHSSKLDRWLREPAEDGEIDGPFPGLSFDPLDEIVSGVLQLRGPRETTPLPSPEMTAYQPTPVRHILRLIAACRLSSDDILVDMGSGLGHVPLLVSILKGIRTIGVEVQFDHAASAQETAQCLNLSRVRFVAEDARTTDLSSGTVFYMFTPFTGSILREVVHRLQDESKRRRIKICALGPCTRVLKREEWLTADQSPDTERITVFESM